MADSSSTALNRALDNIGKCKGPGDFREQGEREGWQKTNSDLFSILFFATEGSAFVT